MSSKEQLKSHISRLKKENKSLKDENLRYVEENRRLRSFNNSIISEDGNVSYKKWIGRHYGRNYSSSPYC
jgi:hypothetical protein